MTIVSRIYLPEPGAASFRLGALARLLRNRGANTTIITSRAPAGYDESATDHKGISIRRARVLRDRMGYVRGYIQYLSFDIPAFFRVLLRRNLRVVVVEPPPTTGVAIRVACALRRVPYLYYAADIWSDAVLSTGAPRVVAKVVRLLEMWAMSGAHTVISVSDQFSTRLVELGVDSTIATVGNGVDTTLFSPHGEQRALPGPYLLYAGTASEVHGATIFLEAFKQVIADVPQAQLVFVGQGAERESLQRMATDLPRESVVFEGRLPSSEVAEWIRGAAATLASVKPAGYHRAFPTKMYASAACGTRVIFAGVGPGREFAALPAMGWSVDYEVDRVAQAMLDALRIPQEQEQRIRTSKWAADHVSLAAVATRASSLIAEAAHSAKRKRD
ncbi:MAG: glycosyltransferase family 4 protein [Homoserinimonas sp.]